MALIKYEGETWQVVEFITDDVIVARKLFDTKCTTDITLFPGQYDTI